MDSDRSLRTRIATIALIATVGVLRLLYLANFCPLDLSPDEAYYWEWSRQLDWSYHSKGPLTAWLMRLSCALLGDTVFAVRVPAVVCGSLLLAGLYVLTVRVYRSERLGLAVVTLALTLPIVAAGGMLMTIDAPFTCAWMWALVFAFRAVQASAPSPNGVSGGPTVLDTQNADGREGETPAEPRTRGTPGASRLGGSLALPTILCRTASLNWLLAGLCLMVGILAKHTMVLFVPSLALFLLTTPGMRGHVRGLGFWTMAGVGALGGVPILLWNALNGWATVRHTQIHAGLDNGPFIRWLGPLQFLGAQFGILLGFWFIAWLLAMWRHHPLRETWTDLRFLWWMSALVFSFFGLFSLLNGGGEANWPVVSYLAGMVLAAGWLREHIQRPSVRFGLGTCAALGLLVTLVLHTPITWQPILLSVAGPATEREPMPIRRIDPTTRLRGWRHLAADVDGVRAELKTCGIEPVLAAERWTQAGELGFYCDGQPRFFCLGPPLGDRDTQYDLWRPNPVADSAAFHGRTFLIVGLDLERMAPAFESMEQIRTITYRENGQPIAEWTLVVAHGFRGWGSTDGVKTD